MDKRKAILKNGFTFKDINDPLEWEQGIASGDIIIMPQEEEFKHTFTFDLSKPWVLTDFWYTMNNYESGLFWGYGSHELNEPVVVCKN